jgi:hypothetical protein
LRIDAPAQTTHHNIHIENILSEGFMKKLVIALLLVPSVGLADKPLITFSDGKTMIECGLANAALSEGFFSEFSSPVVVGECPMVMTDDLTKAAGLAALTAGVPLDPPIRPFVPVLPPIAPWCDCTDEELQRIQAIFEGNAFIVNPGYGTQNQLDAWSDAYGVQSEIFTNPDYWQDRKIPNLDALGQSQFLVVE